MSEQSFEACTDTEMEQWLRSIIRAASTGIGVVKNRVLFQVNEKICEMTGYTSDEANEEKLREGYSSTRNVCSNRSRHEPIF